MREKIFHRAEAAFGEHLAAVLQATTRATDLVRQILTFSRMTRQEARPVQVSLIKSIAAQTAVDDSFLHKPYEETAQWDFGVEVITRLGYDWSHGRQDKAVHPFTQSLGIDDVRITTRIEPQRVTSGLFGTIHEAGHALLGMITPGADRVRKVSIVPRGQALGATFQSPDAERYGYSSAYLRGRITGALGGRAAEEPDSQRIVFYMINIFLYPVFIVRVEHHSHGPV